MSRLIVLAYHAVGSCPAEEDPHNLFVPLDEFERQMVYLARRSNVVPLSSLMDGDLPAGRSVAITFDDAYASVWSHALPILETHRLPAAIFVPTGFLGGHNTWDPATACDLRIMDAEKVRDAAARGMAIESHGHAHMDLAAAPQETIAADLEESRHLLTELTGRAPRCVAYPFGRHSSVTRNVSRQVGFDAAFTIDQISSDPFAYGRIGITGVDRHAVFNLKISGVYPFLRWSAPGRMAFRVGRPVVRRLLR